MKQKTVVALHILLWSYYILQNLVVVNLNTDSISMPILSWNFYNPDVAMTYSFTLLYVVIFYLNYLVVLPRFFDVKNIKRICLALLLLFVCFIGLRYFIEEFLYLKLFGFHNYYDGVSIQYYIYDNIHYGSRPIVASSVLWFIVNMFRLQNVQIQLIESKRETEINFLKSQINPHFIFNTLNNIYYLVFEKSEKSLKAIEQLSGLMRYMTYESQNETIAIQNEINYIEDFIQLESMRIVGKPNIIFEKDIEDYQYRIPPLLLIPFIENGFKHGIVNNEEHPFKIKFKQSRNLLVLEVENLTHQYKKDKQSGVGIDNIKKRLQLYFPNKYTLEINNEEQKHQVKLTINL